LGVWVAATLSRLQEAEILVRKISNGQSPNFFVVVILLFPNSHLDVVVQCFRYVHVVKLVLNLFLQPFVKETDKALFVDTGGWSPAGTEQRSQRPIWSVGAALVALGREASG